MDREAGKHRVFGRDDLFFLDERKLLGTQLLGRVFEVVGEFDVVFFRQVIVDLGGFVLS